MRVTSNTFPNSLVEQMGRLTSRQFRLQNQAASGQRVRLPEDDPVAMRRVLDMQAESSSIHQYKRNIDRHKELATASLSSLRTLKRISDRAREISIAADPLRPPADLRNYARELTELIKQAVQVANTDNRGDYLFAGTRSDTQPFTMTLDADGNVASVTYAGNTSVAESEIDKGATFTTQAVGANTTGSGPRGVIADSRFGVDIFNHLISLQNHLLNADTAAIESTDRAALGRDEENLILHIATNGALQARLEATQAIGTERALTIEGLISKEVDADLAQTLVKLNQTQTAYQAALQSAGRILNTSLLDYLR